MMPQSTNNQNDLHARVFKVVLLGDSGSGKSCLLSRFCRNEFDPDSKTTVGVEFTTYETKFDEKLTRAQIWDSSGRERHQAITLSYYKGAAGLLLVYDVSNRESFDACRSRWLSEIRHYASPDAITVLIGNKCDRAAERVVSTEEGSYFAQQKGFSFIETSARDSKNVRNAFSNLIGGISQRRQSPVTESSNGN